MEELDFESPSDLVDLGRYRLLDLDSAAARAVIEEQRRSLAHRGVAILAGFVKPEVTRAMARQGAALKEGAHLEDVWGSPYLELPDESYAEGHPRRASVHSKTWVIAYDLIPRTSPLRALYEWDTLKDFIAEIIERRPLYRMADPLGALNHAVMEEGHEQCWHYDSTDFVVSLAIQSSRAGGNFECAPFIRSDEHESYDEVARVLAGQGGERVVVFPMTPGTLMIFAGRNSIHRVSPVEGDVARHVALMGYDTTPNANSSDLLKLVRYGRTETLA